MARFAPALLLALSAAWCGTLAGGATSAGSAACALSLLGLLAWIGPSWRDPLRLGSGGRWLPVALWAFAAVSAAASPVPRAGIVGLLLLPAFLGLPGAVARCWRDEASRRQGLRAVSVVVAGCALWALLDRFVLGSPRAAMPLGHHNFLALWLAALLPLAVLPVREGRAWRWLGFTAGLLAVLAVLASRSLMGTAAVVAEGFFWLLFTPLPLAGEGPGVRAPGRRVGIVLATALLLLPLLALHAPRLLGILGGEDPSARARAAYWEAGVEGFLARPFLGQGPGAAAWTASLFLDPVPGVNPWGETVGELHSLPLQLAYELGAPGLLLALATAGLFVVRRWGERRGAVDSGLLRAALCGGAGAAVAFLGTASLAVAALPLALAVAAGAALAGGSDGSVGSDRSVGLVWGYAALTAIALAPLLGAQAMYDRALAADQAGERTVARRRLEQAARLDPAFPLYRLRLALLQGAGRTERRAAAELARQAAERGQGLAAFWTVAGILGQTAQRPWAPAALQTACSLDPLSPFPPWFGMLTDPAGPRAARQGAHALLGEPRLAAAPFWRRHPDLLAKALGEVRAWPGIDAVWTRALLDAMPPPGPAEPSERAGERQWLELHLDVDPSASVSLFAFRRRPWPAQWPVVPLAGGPLERLRRVGPATSRPGIPAMSFAPSICS